MKQLIFIDDSGDPGIINSPSDFLFMAAVVFDSAQAAEDTSLAMSSYREELGWDKRHEFKFRKNPKDVITTCLNLVNKYTFSVYAVYVNKKELVYSPIIDFSRLNDFLINELLKIIPIGQNVKITIDGQLNNQVAKRKVAQLRKTINSDRTKRISIKYEDSAEDNLVQLADLVAGSINRSFKTDKTDSMVYLKLINSKIRQIKPLKI